MAVEDRAVYIDTEDGLGRVRGNQKLYKRMLGMYTQSTELAAFEEAMAAKDYNRVSEVAHGIKGMTGNLGLKRVFELSAEIMTRFRENDIDETLVEEFRDAVKKTEAYVGEVIGELE